MISILFLLSLSLLHGRALGELKCEELPVGMCSFAVSSSGNRCLLETRVGKGGRRGGGGGGGAPYCKTSNARIGNVMMIKSEYIETDSCVKACGVDRMSVGISSDNLLLDHHSRFTRQLCSSRCLGKCPNIADLYHNLALGEGMNLADICKRVYGSSWRRNAFFVNLSGEKPKAPSSDEINVASEPEPEPLLSSASSDDDDDDDNDDKEDEDVASAPEASPLFSDDDDERVSDDSAAAPEASPLFSDDDDERVSDNSAASPAASPEALEVSAHKHHQHRLRSGFLKFKIAARPV